MNMRNTNYLNRRFKKFFKHRKDLRQSLMAFGYECGDGWYQIIKNLFIDIETEFKNPNIQKEFKNDFEVVQVKEKFGELRFYTNFGNDSIFDLIGQAETLSHKVCGNCGVETEDIYKIWGCANKKTIKTRLGDITFTIYGKGKQKRVETEFVRYEKGQVICKNCDYNRIY